MSDLWTPVTRRRAKIALSLAFFSGALNFCPRVRFLRKVENQCLLSSRDAGKLEYFAGAKVGFMFESCQSSQPVRSLMRISASPKIVRPYRALGESLRSPGRKFRRNRAPSEEFGGVVSDRYFFISEIVSGDSVAMPKTLARCDRKCRFRRLPILKGEQKCDTQCGL